MKLSTLEKAQAINNDFARVDIEGNFIKKNELNYRGAIAEIGAGQDVAGYFFEAFRTSNTLVKTMSAYGKGCSDAIYGGTKAPYISEERLKIMLDHDYKLLIERDLHETEKPTDQRLRYFTFANTVDCVSNKQGWAGVLVQDDGCALNDTAHTAKEYRIHFDLLESDKASGIRTAGALGINLIHGSILHSQGNLTDKKF